MTKRWILALAMLLCLCLLAGCQTSEPQRFNVKTSGANAGQSQQIQQTTTNEDDYDPLAEEDDYTGDEDYWQGQQLATPQPATPTVAPTIRSEYAGATPVPVDPIDMPTPTPVPPLGEFSYKTYDATKLGLSFEGPAGWVVDATDDAYYIIQNPKAGIYPATLTIHAEKVSSQYSESDLKTVVKGMLTAIGQSEGLEEYEPSSTASRTLLGAKGIYANYTAVMENGDQIAGRVHAACVEKVLYTVHITYPKAYTEQYKEQVYDKLRDTIQITK